MQAETSLLAIRSDIAATQVYLRAFRLRLLLTEKAGFRPDQPRVPAGNPDGGQWTEDPSWVGSANSGSNTELPLVHVTHRDEPPKIPKRRPPTTRERNSIAVALARYLHAVDVTIETVSLTGWVWDHARERIVAYLEPPRTLDELRRAVADPKFGYDIHHIVERTPALQDGHPLSRLNGPENLVRIPTYRHWQITAWFATKNDAYGNLSPREFLRDQPWEARVAVGLEALRKYGVLEQ